MLKAEEVPQADLRTSLPTRAPLYDHNTEARLYLQPVHIWASQTVFNILVVGYIDFIKNRAIHTQCELTTMDNKPVILYHYAFSPYARRIQWYLALRGVAYHQCVGASS